MKKHARAGTDSASGLKVLLATAYPENSYLPRFQRLVEQDRLRAHSLVGDPEAADIILFVDARPGHGDWRFRAIRGHPLVRRYPEKTFLYNEMDQPWCVLPGLYTSMPNNTFDAQRQRACGYVVRMNPFVEDVAHSTGEPDLLYSFMGRRCRPVRDRVVRLEHHRGYVQDTSEWDFFGGSQNVEGQQRLYAEMMGRSKFIICPRGSGSASFRLFEAMAAGRVPVILSDAWVPPQGPLWHTFAIRVRESQVLSLPQLLQENEHRYWAMASSARQAWEEWFSSSVLFHRMIESCAEIMKGRRWPEMYAQRVPNRQMIELSLRAAARSARAFARSALDAAK